MIPESQKKGDRKTRHSRGAAYEDGTQLLSDTRGVISTAQNRCGSKSGK